MNKAASRESVQERQDAVAEWLRLAVNHAKAAQHLRRHKALRPQMLFLVQQSMEDAVKGIARNAGLSHPDVRHSGHEILRLFVWLHGQVVSTTDTAAYIDDLLARHRADDQKYSTVTQIQDLLMLTTSDRNGQYLGENQRKAARQFFESALTVSPTKGHVPSSGVGASSSGSDQAAPAGSNIGSSMRSAVPTSKTGAAR